MKVVLGTYKGLIVNLSQKAPSFTIDDLEIKKREIQKSYAQDKSVDGPLKNGQTANIDFEGSVDGVVFEGGTAKGYDLVIGSGMFIPGFEEQMVGMEKGETRIVKVKFPDNYTPELSGKDADFKVTVNDIKEKEILPFDEEMAQRFIKDKKLEGVNSLDELCHYLLNVTYQQRVRSVEEEISQKLTESLISSCQVEIDEPVLENATNYQFAYYEEQAKGMGMDVDTFAKMVGLENADALKEQLKNMVKGQISASYIFEEIAKNENIDATEEEIEEYYQEIASSSGEDISKIKETEKPEMLKRYIMSGKAAQMVRESAVINFAN